jgi:hypothetical protein
MTQLGFEAMLHTLADAWSRRDYASAAAFFAEDVHYADPLRYAVAGREQLLAFFTADDGLPQITHWHNIVFDDRRQIGAAEYTYTGTHTYHGVTLVRVQADRITHWREYQHIDSRPWSDFAGATAFEA